MDIKYKEYIINEIEKRFEVWLKKEKGEEIDSFKAQCTLFKVHNLKMNDLLSLCKNENIKLISKNINIWNNVWYS